MDRCFVFTYNNYGEDTPKWKPKIMGYLGWAPQVAPETKTPHLQGYVQFKKNVRFATVHAALETEAVMWIAAARGTPQQAMTDYISEDAKASNNGPVVEFGDLDLTIETKNEKKATGARATRAELLDVRDRLRAGSMTWGQLLHNHPEFYTNKGKREYLQLALQEYEATVPLDLLGCTPDEAVVRMMWNYLESPYQYRDFMWVWSAEGYTGKTSAMTWCRNKLAEMRYKCMLVTPAKANDLNFISQPGCQFFFLDVPRNSRPPWAWIESVINGRVTSGKYESVVKRFHAQRKMIICANYPIDANCITPFNREICLDVDC